MMQGVLENGTLPNITGISDSNYDGVTPNDLETPPGVEFDLVVEQRQVIEDELSRERRSDVIEVSVKDILAVIKNENGEGVRVLNRIASEFREKQNPTISLVIYTDPLDKDSKLMTALFGEDVLEIEELNSQFVSSEEVYRFLDILNDFSTNDTSSYAKFYRETAEKNTVMNSIFRALTSPSTQLGLQSPVSMQEARDVADENTFEASHLNADNPRSIAKQQEANMVGKMGIASVAVAQKGFNGVSYAFNMTVLNLASEYPSLQTEESQMNWMDRLLNGVLLTSFLKASKDGSVKSLANINFRSLIEATEQNPYIRWDLIPVEYEEIKNVSGVYVETINVDGTISKYFNVHEFAKYLQRMADGTDAIDLFSNIMSCATDNAKELLLAKLNAIDENLDLYTYLFATGHTFRQAFAIINSPVFKIIHKYRDTNIFKADSHRNYLTKVINFITDTEHLATVNKNLFDGILTAFDKNVNRWDDIGITNSFFSYAVRYNNRVRLNLRKRIAEKFNVELDGLDLLEKVVELTNEERRAFLLEQLYDKDVQQLFLGWLERHIESKSDNTGWIKEEDESVFDEYQNDDESFDEEQGIVHKYVFNVKDASKDDLRALYNYCEFYLFPKNDDVEALKLSGVDFDSEYKKLMKLTRGAEEMATLGRKIFSINQGMRVGDFEEQSWIENINSDINRKFADSLVAFIPFDIVRFMKGSIPGATEEDVVYADKMVEQYNLVKENINILDVFRKSPHFKEMVNSAMTARSFLESSVALKTAREIASKLKLGVLVNESWNELDKEDGMWHQTNNPVFKSVYGKLNATEWKRLGNLVDEHLIYKFFANLSDDVASFTIDPSTIEYGYARRDRFSPIITSDKQTDYSLNTIEGISTFVRWMELYYIPKIKQELQAKAEASGKGPNSFADMLVLSDEKHEIYKTKKTRWNINKNIRVAQPGEELYDIKAKVVSDFGEIMRMDSELSGFKIGDLFYIYNLLCFKDTNSGMTFLFADAAAAGNTSDWVDAYETYVRDLDHGKISYVGDVFDITPEDVLFALVDESNAYKFNVRFKREDRIPISGEKKTNGTLVRIERPQFLDNSDFPFDAPSVYKDVSESTWTGFNPFRKNEVTISGQEVLHEVITRLNPMLQASGIKIVEVTDSDLDRWEANGELMFANISAYDREKIRSSAMRGFVYNGDIYINIQDRKSPNLGDSQGLIATLMHECVHLICANLKYNPEYKNKYHKMIKNLWQKASEKDRQDYQERYKNKRTSDLMEEYFADQIAKAFAENFEGEFAKIWERAGVNTTQSRAVSVNQLKHDVAETLQNVFGLMEISTDIDFSKLGGTDIGVLSHLFGSILFDFNKAGFTTTMVVLNQELSKVKTQLLDEGKIIEQC